MHSVLPKILPLLLFDFALLLLSPNLATTWAQTANEKSEAAWRLVSLPFRPVCIAGDENVIWVGGVNEMLAKSEDGGKTWEVKHQKVDGEVLLTIGLLGNGTVYAYGTSGITVWSNDSGETWKSWTAGSERVLDISFADSKLGIRHTVSGVQVTRDGGVQWSGVPIMKRNDLLDYSNVFGVAAIASDRLAILVNKTQGENLFIASKDGGATWTAIHLEDAYASRLFVHSGECWAFGMEILERKKGGGYGAALPLHSTDGLEWTHGAKSPWEFKSCVPHGCVLYDGAIAQLYHTKPEYSSREQDNSERPSCSLILICFLARVHFRKLRKNRALTSPLLETKQWGAVGC